MKGRQDHDSLVKALIDLFSQDGKKVQFARYQGFKAPMKINRHPPDVVAIDPKNEVEFIGEAKVCSELTDNMTKEQFEDYSNQIIKKGHFAGASVPFYIMVPWECQTKIKEIFRQNGITLGKNTRILGI